MKESNLGRKLTEDEKTFFIHRWHDYKEVLGTIGTSLTGTKNGESPHTDYLVSANTTIVYEIYQMYHPKASQSSSEAMASKNLKELLSDLKAYLKAKNLEIFN